MARILVVDDESSIRITLKQFLKDADYDVGLAEDADQALAMLAKEDFDIVLTDIIMPRITGVKLLQLINDTSPNVEVILMTGEPTVETASEAVRIGACDYLTKPVIKKNLLKTMANAVLVKSLRDEHRRLKEENRQSQINLERLVDQRTASLRESEERFRGIFQNVHDVIVYVDKHGKILEVNDQVNALLGYEAKEFIGKNALKLGFLKIVNLQKIIQLFIQVIVSGKVRDDAGRGYSLLEVDLTHKNGKEITVEIYTNEVFENGKLSGFISILHNITDRKLAEKTLQASEKNYRSVVQDQTEFIMRFLPDGTRTFVNDSYCRAYNTAPEQMIGTSFFKEIPKSVLHRIEEKIASLTTENPIITDEHELISVEGNKVWHTWTDRGIFDEKGKLKEIQAVGRDITERKQAEEDIRKLSAAVIQSTSLIAITDLDGKLEFVNHKFTEVTGYTSEEAVGQNPNILKSGEHPDEMYKELWKTISSGKKWSGELLNKKKNGDLYWETTTISPLFNAQGQKINYIKFAEDITERKIAEKALVKSRESLAEAQRIAHVGNWELDLIDNILTWSDEVYRIFDFKPQQFEATYEAFLDNIHPDDRELVNKAYTDSLKNKTLYSITHRLLLKDGTIKYVNERCETFYDDDGKAVRSIGTVQDITESKEAENKFTNYVNRIKGINEASHVLTQSLDSKFVIDRSIDIAKEMFKADNVTLFIIEKDEEYLKPLASNGEYVDQIMDFKIIIGDGLTGKVVQEKKPKIVNRIDLTNMGKQVPGTPQEPESLMCAPLKIDQVIIGAILLSKLGEDEFWEDDLAFLVNLADLCAVAIQNSQLYEETQKANKVKDQFIANISHEIRTPLNSLIGFSDLFKQRYGDTVSDQDYKIFGYISDASSRLLHTVDSILNISQLAAGTIQINPRKLDLVSIRTQVVEKLSLQAEKKKLDLRFTTPEQPALIFADEYCIYHALVYLAENAIKYTEKGSVELNLERKNDQILLSVIDTGIGISDEYQARMFEPYTQESEGFTKDFQGIGLGLALTKRYLELNDVKLELTSKKDVGSTFLLTFQKYEGSTDA